MATTKYTGYTSSDQPATVTVTDAPTTQGDRTNVSDKGYTYNGQNYEYQNKIDSQGNTYRIDAPSSSGYAPNQTSMTPNTISTASMMSTPTVTVPSPTTVPTSTYTTPINSTADTLTALQQEARDRQIAVDQANAKGSEFADLIAAAQEKNVRDVAGTYASQGVNTAYNQLQDLAAQATGLKNEASAIPIQNAMAYRGNAGVSSGVETTNRDQLAQNALKALSLGQQYAIAEGNYNKAKNIADQLIDTKFAAEEARIKSLQTQQAAYEKYTLTPAEQKRLDAVKKATDAEATQLAEKKATEKSVSDMLVQAASIAPQDVLARAKEIQAKGGSAADVAMALGQYSGNYWAIEKAKQEVIKLKAETNKINSSGTPSGTATGYVAGKNPQVDSWVKLIGEKRAKITDVPMAMRSQVALGLGVSPEAENRAKSLSTDIETILNRMKGYQNVVIGANAQTFPVQSQRFGDTAEAIADAERLSALLTTENIALMKGLGSMSNIEFGNIEKIGSSIIGRDKEGNAFFKGNRSNYDREVQRLLDDIAKTNVQQSTSGSVWESGDTQNQKTPLSSMGQKGYINPNAPFGTIEFNLPKPTK